MTVKTEAWWVCHTCGKSIVKKGKKGVKRLMLEHRKKCTNDIACFKLEQVPQKKDDTQ